MVVITGEMFSLIVLTVILPPVLLLGLPVLNLLISLVLRRTWEVICSITLCVLMWGLLIYDIDWAFSGGKFEKPFVYMNLFAIGLSLLFLLIQISCLIFKFFKSLPSKANRQIQ